jgi:hypothetical protein
MTRPQRFLNRMAAFLLAVIVVCALIWPALYNAFMGNAALNGIILGAMLVGILYIFRQVWMLNREVGWIEAFRTDHAAVTSDSAPRLLASMATMLGERSRGGRVSLSATALRTLLDGISTRLDESREISRYFIGLLVFLGLLGTFYGLLETLGAVAGIISGMSVGGGDIARAWNDLKAGLEAPLTGMGTAFSASLFGLAGSLVLGFLDLQAGQAQNRFYNDLEEWLSGFTRLSSGSIGEAGETPVPAYIQALLEQTADSLENLQRIMARGEESRIGANASIVTLSDRLGTLGEQMRAEQTLLLRLAENQMELKPILARLADAGTRAGSDETLRGHLRNIEHYLAHLGEELANGRAQTVQEVRAEIRLLARTIAALAEEAEREGR